MRDHNTRLAQAGNSHRVVTADDDIAWQVLGALADRE